MVTVPHALGVGFFVLAFFLVFVNTSMTLLKAHRLRRGIPGNVSGVPLVGPVLLALATLALHDVTAARWLGAVLLVVDLGATAALVTMHRRAGASSL